MGKRFVVIALFATVGAACFLVVISGTEHLEHNLPSDSEGGNAAWDKVDTLDRLLSEAGEAGLPPRTPVLLVFHRGIKCVQCMSQLSLLGSKQEEFDALGVELVGLCPEMPKADIVGDLKDAIGVTFPLVLDREQSLFKAYDCLGPDEEIMHGLVLLDSEKTVVWKLVTEHAFNDTEEVLKKCRTLTED